MAFDFDNNICVNDNFTDKLSLDIISIKVNEFNNIIKHDLEVHPEILENMIIDCYEVFDDCDNHVFDITSDNKIMLSFNPSEHEPYIFHAWNYQLGWLITKTNTWDLFYHICESDFFIPPMDFGEHLNNKPYIPYYIHKNMNIDDSCHLTFLGVWNNINFYIRYDDLLHAIKYWHYISKNISKSIVMDYGKMEMLSKEPSYINEMYKQLHLFLVQSQSEDYKEAADRVKLSANMVELIFHVLYKGMYDFTIKNILKMKKHFTISTWYSIFINPETNEFRPYTDFINTLKSRCNSLGYKISI